MALDSFQIIAGETWARGPLYLEEELPTGATISSGTVSATLVNYLGADYGTVDNTVIGNTTATTTSLTASVLLQPSSTIAGRIYKIEFTLTLTNTNVFKTAMWMQVVGQA